MAQLTLSVQKREKSGSKSIVRRRKEGLIPAVVYGHGLKPQSLWVNAITFGKVFSQAGQSSILGLVSEDGKPANVIVHDIQLDPLTSRFSHIDFFQVRMDEELETHVPLEFIGESPAVREQGGTLVRTLEELSISCLPKDLPHSIEVDLATLKNLDDRIQVSDLKIPAGVKVLAEAEMSVALIEAPRTEAQMAELDTKVEGDVTQVEAVAKEEEPSAEGEAQA